jgi:tripartite-type tricarboxylate transporter receptor subunit TctC
VSVAPRTLAGLLVVCALAPVHGATAQEFFRGKTITIVIGSGPAGSYDNFGRLAARHLGRFVPGNPNVVAQNMPGAGSIQTANYIYNIGPKDGTALGLMSPSTTVMQTFPGARYEAARFRWIGRINSNTNVTFVRSDAPVRSIEDARNHEVKLGATAPSSPLAFQTRLMNQVAGTKFHMILGYIDAAASMLAVERGEVDGGSVAWNTLKTARPQWIESGFVKVILQYGLTPNPELPNVPLAGNIVQTESARRLMSVFMNAADVGYSLMAAPETPQDRVDTLRTAFQAMVVDPQYLEDAGKIENSIFPLGGAELERMIRNTSVISPEIRESAAKALTTD